MSAVDLDQVLSGLREFQRDAVAHVVEQFFGAGREDRSGRFLIADETGLGKSVIARGIVAHTIRELETDDSVDRIDVIYICSNRDLATQNLKRLNVTGEREVAMSTRLSLLAKENARLKEQLRGPEMQGRKAVNLVSFTPGTSFSASWRQGKAEERALLVLLLDELLQHTEIQKHATRVLFQGSVHSLQRFTEQHVGNLARLLRNGIDPEIQQKFETLAHEAGLIERFVRLRGSITGDCVPEGLWHETQDLIGKLRMTLSYASVESLEPDLVILDEFQRFKDLLDPETGGEAAELADALFSYPNAKVLLLSATPYKPFTQSDGDEEDHYEDFLATISFLCGHDQERVRTIQQALYEYRLALATAADAQSAASRVRELLIPLMTRSERPNTVAGRQLVAVKKLGVPVPTPRELTDWMGLHTLGTQVGYPVSVEQWKSIPYFVNFMDTYRVSALITEQADAGARREIDRALSKFTALDGRVVERRQRIDPGNGPLKTVMSETVGQGWWKLLWMPPSMPYLKPGPVYSAFSDGSVTKQVIFSAWTATPTAIATIMSHEAERLMAGVADEGLEGATRHSTTRRFTYRQVEDHGANVSALALFWPHPGLATLADQLEAVRAAGDLLDPVKFVEDVEQALPPGKPTEQAWEAYFAVPGAFDPETTDVDFALRGDDAHSSDVGLRTNLEAAMKHAQEVHEPLMHRHVARLIAFSPGSVALRAVAAIAGDSCSKRGIWRAAWVIAEGLRSLFNRIETQELLDQLDPDPSARTPYWSRVLDYCADGNLRAVLDEYLFQLWCETGQTDVQDTTLLDFAATFTEAIGLRPARYQAHTASVDRDPIPMNARFAVRYGGGDRGRNEADSAVARQSVVRAGFNSPFAPFVLASTSVGQEGIDFHWWSHSVIHWNLPSNPVDFEQREGRVNRYGGHAVRKNVAQTHWSDVLTSEDANAWRAAFDAATHTVTEAEEFSPWWVYPGDAQIQRTLVQYPLSKDIDRYDRLREALTYYRLTLGQPRQEDMVEILARRNLDASEIPVINLRPPRRNNPGN